MWKTKSRLGSFWLQLSHTPPREPPAKVGWWWGGGGRKGRLEMSNEGRIFYLFRFAPTPPHHSRRLVFFRLLHYSPFLVMPSCPLFTLVETSWEKRRRTDTEKKWAAAELTWIHLTRYLSLALPASSSHRIWVKASFFLLCIREKLSRTTHWAGCSTTFCFIVFISKTCTSCAKAAERWIHIHTLTLSLVDGAEALNWIERFSLLPSIVQSALLLPFLCMSFVMSCRPRRTVGAPLDLLFLFYFFTSLLHRMMYESSWHFYSRCSHSRRFA